MLVSYNWLQSYFDAELPKPNELGLLLNTRAFEVEGIVAVGDDFSIDIDVQPNRAHDCMCHAGIAKEISVLTSIPLRSPEEVVEQAVEPARQTVTVLDDRVARYMCVEIDSVHIAETPSFIQERLTVLNQRSINAAVDIANYVMFEVGQPLHVFDADKVVGALVLRAATQGETMVTLDGVDVSFKGGELLVADEQGPLAIAGIKGGSRAAVTEQTTRVLLEAANFNASAIRQTSSALGISTDASKRFERAITPALAEIAMQRFAALLRAHISTAATKQYASVDVYPRPAGVYKTGVSLTQINTYLGVTLDATTVERTLDRLGFAYELVDPHAKIVALAESLVANAEYKYGASVLHDAPRAFDCSSLVSYVHKEAGVSIPRVTVDQYMWGTPITEAELVPGDIIFCDLGGTAAGKDKKFYHQATVDFMQGTPITEPVDHNGIYIGNGEVVHASSKAGNTVAREHLSESLIFKNVIGYRRLVAVDEQRYVITVPNERLDIRIPADVIEEIARVHGYEHITPAPLSNPGTYEPNAEYAYTNHVRNTLAALGFSEIMTSTFTATGTIAAEKPLASDKAFLRTNLTDAMKQALSLNEKHLDLLGLDRVRVFEIGKVFSDEEETLRLCIGVSGKKADSLVTEALQALSVNAPVVGGVAELSLQIPASHADVVLPTVGDVVYKPFSVFPFIVRDIAFWAPADADVQTYEQAIKDRAGDLLVRLDLFDVYKKDDRTSYAFRIVFQADDRTLTDVEVNESMDRVTAYFTDLGLEVR